MRWGSRVMGFTQELFNDSAAADPEADAQIWGALAGAYPWIYELHADGQSR